MWPTTTRPPRLYFLGEIPHLVDKHAIGRVTDIQMHVDIDVEFTRKFEDAFDLRRAVGVH